jgi:hypothetical protein
MAADGRTETDAKPAEARLAPAETIALPDPLRAPYLALIPFAGWSSVLAIARSGAVLRLDFDGIAVSVSRTAVILPPFKEIDRASASGQRMAVVLDERLHIFDLATGDALSADTLGAFGFNVAALADRGRLLFAPDRAEVAYLPDPPTEPARLIQDVIPEAPELDSPDSLDLFQGPDGYLHLTVGSYGRAHLLRLTGQGDALTLIDRHEFDDLVYDPVAVQPGGLWPYACILDGYGMYARALDVRDGAMRSFPAPVAPSLRGYSLYRQMQPSAPGELLVSRKDGWFQWRVEEGSWRWLGPRDQAGEVLWVAGDTMWSLLPGDPDHLHRFVVEGARWEGGCASTVTPWWWRLWPARR